MIRVGVIGLGLIGGSIARRLAELPASFAVVGLDEDGEVARSAAAEGLTLADSPAALARASDLVVIAAPPRAAGRLAIEALEASTDALVMDVASVKQPIAQTVRDAAPSAVGRFLPTHPLAGAETSGWAAGRADLLDGAAWALCPPSEDAPAEPLCLAAQLLDAFDARIVVCTAQAHDLAVARTSHAPHVAASAIAAGIAAGPSRLAAVLSGGSFRDMTRVARAEPALWSEILELNAPAVAQVVDEWHATLGDVREAIAKGDLGALGELWDRGRRGEALAQDHRREDLVWRERELAWPGWEELLALGDEGRAIRRVRPAEGSAVALEVADAVPAR